MAFVDIVNKSLARVIFPSEHKMAEIVPVYKSGQEDKIENYRPISLLPVFSKILEKIVTTQIDNCLTSNNLLYVTQYGLRPKLSTEMAIQALTDSIYIYIYIICRVKICRWDIFKLEQSFRYPGSYNSNKKTKILWDQ